jgi:hypothetical protein
MWLNGRCRHNKLGLLKWTAYPVDVRELDDVSVLVLLGIILVPAVVTFVIFTVARRRRARFHYRHRH